MFHWLKIHIIFFIIKLLQLKKEEANGCCSVWVCEKTDKKALVVVYDASLAVLSVCMYIAPIYRR